MPAQSSRGVRPGAPGQCRTFELAADVEDLDLGLTGRKRRRHLTGSHVART